MIRGKKLITLILLVAVATSVAGCFTIRIGGKAELAPSSEEGTKIAHKRCWYALWGLVPIGDNSTDSLIPETARKVRVETKYTVPDFLINIFTILLTIETFTVEIYEVK
ncbi:MAG TPA: hypothetical protein VLZ10_14040 [Thermodesulfobacteriota bacterium]|nr:hypothetical protein [Thermodesulfobacteriota bacterium]